MDGLEAVELRLSEVLQENDTFRYDAEYFGKEYLRLEYDIKKRKNINLEKFIEILTDGKHGGVTFTQSGVLFIRNNNVLNGSLDISNPKYISNSESLESERAEVYCGDILLTTIGTIGESVVVPIEIKRANINQNLVKIRLKDNNSPIFISNFLNCKYGRFQTKRFSTGNVQPLLNYPRIKNILIPDVSNDFLLKIEQLVKSAHQKLEQSKTLYCEAENLLLTELDLVDFKPSDENIAIKSFSESFGECGRLDSEYYQPKYDEIIAKVKGAKYDILDNIINIQKSIEPGSNAYQDNGIPFVRVSNLTKYGVSNPSAHLKIDIFDIEKLDILQPKKNTILLSKDGTVGIAYNIKKDTDFITSGALLHLTIKDKYKGKVFNEYLTLVLNSVVVQMQSQRDAGGSIIKHWKPSEVKQVLIPIIDYSIQTQIEQKIKQSFKLKEQSKQLLELAKKAVEVAIEQDETRAIQLLNNNQ